MREEKDVRVEILQQFYNRFLQFIHFQMTKSNFADKARTPEEEYKDTLTKNLSSLLTPINEIQRLNKNS